MARQGVELFASASNDGTVRLWSLVTGKCLEVLMGRTRAVTSVWVGGSEKCEVPEKALPGLHRSWDEVIKGDDATTPCPEMTEEERVENTLALAEVSLGDEVMAILFACCGEDEERMMPLDAWNAWQVDNLRRACDRIRDVQKNIAPLPVLPPSSRSASRPCGGHAGDVGERPADEPDLDVAACCEEVRAFFKRERFARKGKSVEPEWARAAKRRLTTDPRGVAALSFFL